MKTFEEHLAIMYDEHLIAELETGKAGGATPSTDLAKISDIFLSLKRVTWLALCAYHHQRAIRCAG